MLPVREQVWHFARRSASIGRTNRPFRHIKIKGLMTIAPFVENPEENRIHFANLRKLSVDIAAKNIDNVSMRILSMGMTNDYEVR